MNSTSHGSSAIELNPAAETTSWWSVVSWVFFGLVVLSSLAFGFFWLYIRSTSAHPIATVSVDLVQMVLMAAVYWIAWACALAGAITGLVGVSKPGYRTKQAWIAVALNGSFWFVVTAMLWVVG